MSVSITSYTRVLSSNAANLNTLLSSRRQTVYELHVVKTQLFMPNGVTAAANVNHEARYGVVPGEGVSLLKVLLPHAFSVNSKAGGGVEVQEQKYIEEDKLPPDVLVPQFVVRTVRSGTTPDTQLRVTLVYTIKEVSMLEWLGVNQVWGADIDQPHPPILGS